MKSVHDTAQDRTSPSPIGPLDAYLEYENFRQSHRHGRTLRELHRAADRELADEGGIAPLEITPLTRLPINWGVICFYGALLLVATVALVKLYLEAK
jgi:hypothetical protein